MDKTVYILRSVSGAGKSTLANKLAPSWCIFEADKYLYDGSGRYDWTPERLQAAHKQCFERYCQYVEDGLGPLVVSNTNTSRREFQKYIDKATAADYTVISIVLENRHGGVDTHNVPAATLDAQEQRIRSSLCLRPKAG